MIGRRDRDGDGDSGAPELREVVDWQPESTVDRLIYRIHRIGLAASRGALVVAALAILAGLFALGSLGAVTDPVIGLFVVLSAVPALALVAYIRYADVTAAEPLRPLVVTFLLGLLFAGFAGVSNELLVDPVASVLTGVGLVRPLVLAVVFFCVVAPVEEGVKLLAVRVYAYRHPQFDAVVVGAVYGATAGLGFATIENALYITQVADGAATLSATLVQGGSIATQRALAGPGHVIYSAFAGYYLGLARVNRRYAGPIVLKGLLVAVFIHGGYNLLVTLVPDYLGSLLGFSPFAAVVTFVIAYDGIFALLLVRKLSVYRAAYRAAHTGEPIPSERTEFE
jgi:RsiW-degrading membrane proteinase PrsW (M82 family)